MIAIASLTVLALLAQVPLVDLVTNPPNPGEARSVTYTVGGRSFHHPSAKSALPLEIDFLSISASPSRPLIRIVEISIRNTGQSPYFLPVGREGDVVFARQNRGRHEVRFGLKIRSDREPYIFGSSTFGSPDVPGSLFAIPPGGSVRVRFPAQVEVARAQRWKAERKFQIEVEAGFTDWRYEDSPTDYVVNVTEAPEVFSQNSTRLPLE